MSADTPFPEGTKTTDCPVDFVAVLWEELREIKKLRHNRGLKTGSDNSAAKTNESFEDLDHIPPPDEVFKRARESELIGLAFSGGGIRSATFNLGVLQGFATLGLLPIFDYLSTVSGGGYIGGWFESWIYRAGSDTDVAICNESKKNDPAILRVQECLKPDRSSKIEHAESTAIRFLREYSNYLTPRLGFLGADLWTAVAIYLRNLILNQSILILFLSFVLLLPYLAVYLSHTLSTLVGRNYDCFHYAAPFSAFMLMLLAQFGVANNMAHLTGVDRTGEFPPSARQGPILAYVATPLLLSAWCLSVWIWHARIWSCPRWVWSLGGVVVFSLTWSLAAAKDIMSTTSQAPFWNSRTTRFISILCSIISGAFGGLLLREVTNNILQKQWGDYGIFHIVSFGPRSS